VDAQQPRDTAERVAFDQVVQDVDLFCAGEYVGHLRSRFLLRLSLQSRYQVRLGESLVVMAPRSDANRVTGFFVGLIPNRYDYCNDKCIDCNT